jgi:hypothetical protein
MFANVCPSLDWIDEPGDVRPRESRWPSVGLWPPRID